jgi:ectoine hydrolase
VHSAEELDCIRHAGKLCADAMEALVAKAKPGVTEYQLRAAAGAAIMEGGGDIDFLIIGTTSMANPAMVFGNPRPSGRKLQKGDIINMELAAGYRGYSAQIGSPICLGPPTDMVKRFWEDITLPVFEKMAAAIKPGNPVSQIQEIGKEFRAKGVQSRPIHAHGIDLITDGPHVFCDGVHGEPFEQVFRPGMVFMAEPNPITADGQFGIFMGHTFIVTETGNECVDKFPWEMIVVS